MINTNESELKKVKDSNLETNSFLNSIKYIEDPDKRILLKIQDEIEIRGINKENIFELTKNLSQSQKEKLKKLYKEQNNELSTNINNYRNKIIAIRKKLKI